MPAGRNPSRRDPAADADLRRLADVLGMLSDPTRLRILFLLSQGERNVAGLCADLGVPQPTASHHLGLLRMTGLLVTRREGKSIYYSLASGVVDPADRPGGLTVAVPGFRLRLDRD